MTASPATAEQAHLGIGQTYYIVKISLTTEQNNTQMRTDKSILINCNVLKLHDVAGNT
jgi:hypothetical protein